MKQTNTPTSDLSPKRKNSYQDAARRAIELEKAIHELRSERRFEVFSHILYNTACYNPRSTFCKLFLHGVCSVFGSVLLTCFYTLIPVHNLFINSHYWYELPLQGLFALLPMLSATIIIRCSNFMNIEYIKTLYYFFVMWMSSAIAMFIEQAMAYFVWSEVLQFKYPVPLNGYLAAFIILITLFMTLWYQFPTEWRRNSSFRRRLRYAIIAVSCNQALVFEYGILTKIMLIVPQDYQWTIALFLPFIREINIFL